MAATMSDEVVLRTEGLTCRFGRRVAVENVNLSMNAGDIYGFLGPNGAGKTTTMRLILQLVRPAAGRIFAFGMEIRKHFKAVMSRIGALIEVPALYPGLSPLEHLEITARLSGVKPDRKRLTDLLERLRLADRMREPTRHFSQGMRQRLGIALALVHRPGLVLLDEPTNGLDPEGIHQIRALIRELNSRDGTSFLLSSHQLHEIEMICNRFGILRAGRLVDQQPIEELKRRTARTVRIRARPMDRALDWLRAAPLVEKAEAEGDSILVTLVSDRHARLNAELVRAGLEVEEFAPRRMTLEEYFLLAGK